MAPRSLMLTLCLLGLVAAHPVTAQDLDFTITPTPVKEGGTINVTVTSAPELPVEVQIFIGGVLWHEETIQELPGTVSATVPAGSAGRDWEVVVAAGEEEEDDFGTIVPANDSVAASPSVAGADRTVRWFRPAMRRLRTPSAV